MGSVDVASNDQHQQQHSDKLTDPTVRPNDPRERQRQTDPKTKKHTETQLPDWQYEWLTRASADYRAWLLEALARGDLDPEEAEAARQLARDLPAGKAEQPATGDETT